MPAHTRIHDALTRSRTEQDAVGAERDAIGQSIERVEACSSAPRPAAVTYATATVSHTPRERTDQCQTVRQGFAETIEPHSLDGIDDSESLHETIRTELSGAIAIAPAPTRRTALTELGFEKLRARHERLSAYRSCCREPASHRQDFLPGATSQGETIGVSHSDLVDDAYRDFPAGRPVLATVARLDETCGECQRIVRQHPVRRV